MPVNCDRCDKPLGRNHMPIESYVDEWEVCGDCHDKFINFMNRVEGADLS